MINIKQVNRRKFGLTRIAYPLLAKRGPSAGRGHVGTPESFCGLWPETLGARLRFEPRGMVWKFEQQFVFRTPGRVWRQDRENNYFLLTRVSPPQGPDDRFAACLSQCRCLGCSIRFVFPKSFWRLRDERGRRVTVRRSLARTVLQSALDVFGVKISFPPPPTTLVTARSSYNIT